MGRLHPPGVRVDAVGVHPGDVHIGIAGVGGHVGGGVGDRPVAVDRSPCVEDVVDAYVLEVVLDESPRSGKPRSTGPAAARSAALAPPEPVAVHLMERAVDDRSAGIADRLAERGDLR